MGLGNSVDPSQAGWYSLMRSSHRLVQILAPSLLGCADRKVGRAWSCATLGLGEVKSATGHPNRLVLGGRSPLVKGAYIDLIDC